MVLENGLESERIRLRQWRDSDLDEYARLCGDPHVMRYFPAPLSREESDHQADIIRTLITDRGWGFWAAELKETGEFMGFVGLHRQEADSGIPEAPFVEIGWRLAAEYWGKGYAPEAAQVALKYAFETLDAPAVYAFTTLTNEPSQRVMRKIGMVNVNQDFDHPKLSSDHPLVRHCLYKITNIQWRE